VRVWTAQADSQVGPPPQMTPTGGSTTAGLAREDDDEITQVRGSKARKLAVVGAFLALGVGGFLGYRTMLAEDGDSATTVGAAAAQPGGQGAAVPPVVEERDPMEGTLPLAQPKVEPEAKAEAVDSLPLDATPKPKPRPSGSSRPAAQPSPAPAAEPTPKPKPKPKFDDLDSNPYR